jgi:hypothetical protein
MQWVGWLFAFANENTYTPDFVAATKSCQPDLPLGIAPLERIKSISAGPISINPAIKYML